MKIPLYGGLLWLLLLSSCSDRNRLLKKDFYNTGKELTLTVYAYCYLDELNLAVMNPTKGLNGQAVYAHADNICDIHAKKPKNVKLDDDYAKTLGHELMHCLYGDYHPHF